MKSIVLSDNRRGWLSFSLVTITIVVALFALIIQNANGQGISSARSVAMGSAGISLASGADAARLNPANLGFAQYQLKGVELVGVGANISNNSFTLSDYNKYTGAFLTDEDKEYILDRVSDDGLKLTAEAEATALAIAMGPFVFGVAGNGVADVNLNKDIIDLILNGNTFADTIEVTGSYSDVIAYASAYLSYGRSLYKSGSREFAVGATFRYLRGFAVEQVVELRGIAATFATGFMGEGNMVIQTATGGSGYSVDLGAALKLNDNYTVGGRIRNFVSAIKWTKDTEEHGYYFSFDTMTVDNMDEDYVVSEDYTEEIGSFTTNLPSVMTLGVAKTSGKLLWAVDWEQGFSSEVGGTTKPRISAGAEYSIVSAFPLRMGYSAGGNRNSAFSFGSGFHLPYFFVDYAFVTGSSLSGYSSKGLNFAVTTGLYF
ncbi:MAG: DUF5723 family protein [Candidatus Zixiibacteriota bacterium]